MAALLDLGANPDVLKEALDCLPLDGFRYEVKRVKKSGLDVCDFSVILEQENHDHDMEFLHGHEQHHDHTHGENHHHDHHEHAHGEGHHHDSFHTHHHEHRNLNDIMHIISHAKLTTGARQMAEKIFMVLGRAEAKAHGVGIEEVHFHEVGAVDSIVDIVAVAVCLDNLGIHDVIIPALWEGKGTVRCQHGILPVPVPATANIIKESGLKLHIMDVEGEFVTPTGAAIAAAIQTGEKLPETFSIKKIGLGGGKRSYERPSILRIMLIETEDKKKEDKIVKLETNVDDCTGENLGYVMEYLMQAGAKDVHYMPVYMKKNRPAYQLNIICDQELVPEMERILFSETTTIGIRRVEMERTILKREETCVETPYGSAMVKVCTTSSGEKKYYPEYESVVQLCRSHKIGFGEMYHMVLEASHKASDHEEKDGNK